MRSRIISFMLVSSFLNNSMDVFQLSSVDLTKTRVDGYGHSILKHLFFKKSSSVFMAETQQILIVNFEFPLGTKTIFVKSMTHS